MTCSNPNHAPIASPDDGKLAFVKTWQQRWHCRTCAACRRERAQMEQMEDGLRQLASAPTPAPVYTALLAQLSELSDAALPVTSYEDLVLDRNGRTRKRMKRRRRSIAIGACLAVAIGSSFVVPELRGAALYAWDAGIYALERHWEEQAQEPEVANFMNDAVRAPAKFDARNLTKVKEMRARWKPWAMQHQQELQQMLKVNAWGPLMPRPVAVNTVFDLLPARPPETGSGLKETDFWSYNHSFNWNPESKLSHKKPYHFQEDFVEFHDIALSRSTGFSSITYTLWVSGRITAEKHVPVHRSTLYWLTQRKRVSSPRRLLCQVEPPYNELLPKEQRTPEHP